jgi:hypothetical protein
VQLRDEDTLQHGGREWHPCAELELEHDERLETDQGVVNHGALFCDPFRIDKSIPNKLINKKPATKGKG